MGVAKQGAASSAARNALKTKIFMSSSSEQIQNGLGRFTCCTGVVLVMGKYILMSVMLLAIAAPAAAAPQLKVHITGISGTVRIGLDILYAKGSQRLERTITAPGTATFELRNTRATNVDVKILEAPTKCKPVTGLHAPIPAEVTVDLNRRPCR